MTEPMHDKLRGNLAVPADQRVHFHSDFVTDIQPGYGGTEKNSGKEYHE